MLKAAAVACARRGARPVASTRAQLLARRGYKPEAPTSQRATSEGYGDKGRKWWQPWLSDKSLYPLLAVTGTTIAFAMWFAPTWHAKDPNTMVDPIRRRDTMSQKKEGEGLPISRNMYEKSQDMTKAIYRVTIKDEDGEKPDDVPGADVNTSAAYK